MFYRVREQKLQLNGMALDTIRFGSGKKQLVMIQGLNTGGIKGAGLSLALMYRLFCKDYTVWLFDRRPDIPDGFTAEQMAEDVAAAMDALSIRNADVIGVSQGGMIAQYLALNRPELVHKLVLAVTLCRNNDTVRAVIANWIALTEQRNYAALTADMAQKMYSDAYLKRYRPFLPLLTLLQKPKDPTRFIRLAKACLSCDTYDRLSALRCPVLVIGGGKDKILTGAASVELAEKCGGALVMYENLGHAAYEEAKEFHQTVYDWLQ